MDKLVMANQLDSIGGQAEGKERSDRCKEDVEGEGNSCPCESAWCSFSSE